MKRGIGKNPSMNDRLEVLLHRIRTGEDLRRVCQELGYEPVEVIDFSTTAISPKIMKAIESLDGITWDNSSDGETFHDAFDHIIQTAYLAGVVRGRLLEHEGRDRSPELDYGDLK